MNDRINQKENLDEMQAQLKNKLGNQSFLMMFYLLMIDIGLSGFGVKWLAYPMNVFVIMLFSMGYYLIRIIWSGAYVGPRTQGKNRKYFIVSLVGAIFLSALAVIITTFFKGSANIPNAGGAEILFIISFVLIVIAVIVSIISNRRNNRGNE